ncbi:MAG: UDP-N-acetylglucosamine--N-acetylmuramyl-(pentapeptide) pyrophosphoryl-undecaprenol N-acetylglucosamine transferase, partial [Actinomycetota bacterium]|nr:UDP-N-acetylglucosamine--N-acetylmuramyl-(pentapeptide) pyrophosphoryl-undecaprenol N-acetylglucosamine transferase [Actinomycetota bacterium]
MTYAIAAAGTGGHVYPALAVAEELVAAGVPRQEVLFLGGERIEARVVPAAGFPFVALELAWLRRDLSPANLTLPLLVVRAARQAAAEMRARGVRAVLGMGGYATGPVAWAARRLHLPVFVHEQNAVPGLANRWASRWARRTFVAFPTAAVLPRSEVVGNPLRRELVRFSRAELRPAARERYSLEPGRTTLGVLGGSLGAASLNRAVARLVGWWDGPPLQVVHLAGSAAVERLSGEAHEAPLPWRVLPFEDRMELFYAAADLVVSRAGALTVSELAATGTPAVLVPPGRLGRLNQAANAAHLVEVGGAELLSDDRLVELPR